MRLVILLGILSFTLPAIGQNRKDWTRLDFLNQAAESLFKAEQNISGQCFIILADKFDYYKRPIIIKSADNKELIRVEVRESLITTFNGKSYIQCDQENPFKPWLFGCNPDYFQLAFECIDSTGTDYKVKINETESVLISKTNSDFKKQSIAEFVKDWTTLGCDFDRSANPLRETPTSNGKIIEHPDQKQYKIWNGESLEVQGDWIKIKTLTNE